MNTLEEIRPVWAEINLDNLAYNIQQVRKYTNENSMVMAIVKANGYGHGAVHIARTLLDNGADRLGVASLSEGIELRRTKISQPILILGYTPPRQYKEVLEYNLTQTIFNYNDALILSEKAVELNKEAIIHIKLDTGMGRIGFQEKEDSIEDIIKISKLPKIHIEGIFTHFATADEKDKSYTKKQFQVFTDMVEKIESKGLFIPIKHVSNSAAIIDLPEYNLDMVRAGIMIYGLYPSKDINKENIELRNVMTLKTRISNIKTVNEGTAISYGRDFITDNESKIATIPIGYADGFTRLLAGKSEVVINQQRAKIVGRICMDQSMIDISHMEKVKIGDEVIIFGDNEIYPTIDELAEKIGTINYEIVCMISRRVPRVYFYKKKLIQIVDYLLNPWDLIQEQVDRKSEINI